MTAPGDRVHVLLLNWNGWRDTIECLESLLQLTWPDTRFVVCDNGSSNDSLERLHAWGRTRQLDVVYYHRDEAEAGGDVRAEGAKLVLINNAANLGFAGGNNVGLRYLLARGESGYVWLLNNDTVVAPDALAELIGVARRDPKIGIVGSTLLLYDHPDTLQEAAGGQLVRWHGWTRRNVATKALDFVTGASMLLRLETVRDVGLMDERYFLYSEDVDWCLAMRARGLSLAHAPGSRVWHKEGASSVHRSPLHDYYSVKSALLLVQKHDPHLVPAAMAYSFARCAMPKVVRGEWRRLHAVGRGWLDFLRQSYGQSRTPASPQFGRNR